MIEAVKRSADMALVPAGVKRPRTELVAAAQSQQLATMGPPRSSSLQAPIMLLSGHEGEVYCCKFHPNGSMLASAGFDRLILLWNVYGECENFATLKGHTGAVMELHYNTDGSLLFSASTDKTVCVWDSETGERVKRLKGHTSFVNSCFPARRGPQLACTGSDDGTVKLWDIRKKASVHTFQNTYQVLSVTFNDTSDQIISGGIDNDIKVWDLRQNKLIYSMQGHGDSVTGLTLSSEGSYLLSNSMDNSVRVWDIRPFAPKERCVKIFQGNVHNFEKPFRDGLAGVFWIIVLLQNPSSRQLEVTNLPIYQSGKGYKAISKALGLPRTTVRAIIYKWRKHGTVENLPRSGRPTKITPRVQRQLIQEVTKDPTTTSKELQASLASVKNLLRCSWSPDGSKIAAGSADRFVYIWDTTSRRILYKLPGHAGSVNEVAFHPEEPIVLSGSSDKRLYMGEIQ
ncbi:hypothetical protein QTP70_014554 [Hemibagrus guttatus]|uniref:Sleeping Beauty transposase HTH domain-containing protein n=1 Tax=Hemibagrus guttatus TaxID=175788 RepID=A0AAE0Q0V2_9TELE|nr:hypothetical protein QTP70_014554 [Hemibagrus guttatus]